MNDLEIPLKKRTPMYRLFEMVPALISVGAIALLIILSLTNPLLAAVYLLLIVITMLVKAAGIAFHMFTGQRSLKRAAAIDWRARLEDLEHPGDALERLGGEKHTKRVKDEVHHIDNLEIITTSDVTYPRPSELYNAVIIATYNEPYEVLQPTIESLKKTTYNSKQLIVLLAYEERGGDATEANAKRLEEEFRDDFKSFVLVKHPKHLPDEIVGKGANITYAGQFLQKWLDERSIAYSDVIVTTLDSDNRTHKSYFDYVTYEYIVHDNRKHLSYQPVSLFLNNIWDVPAPMRVVATGNSFWNIISSVRPHILRNFASHSQPMDALVEMDFWSKRTIVEDGHQYWRSYFYFKGDYGVVPISVPIYQDAVMSETYLKTLKAQFTQLQRWAYGASDVPYVAVRLFSRKRSVPFFAGVSRFFRLLDGHITLACIPILVTFGGWGPLFLNPHASQSIAANELPEVVSILQRVATVGLFITVFFSFKMLPPRPERYKRRRTFGMLIQWVLMPVTSLAYSSLSAYNSQIRLFLGKYLTKFNVTEKATVATIERDKQKKIAQGQ